MSERIIQVPENTREAHRVFIGWINSLMEHYVSSFYDEAVTNFIELCFINKHYNLIIEVYSDKGDTLMGFLSVLPTSSTKPIMMFHPIGTGKPICYNKTDVVNLFTFKPDGRLKGFEENVVIYMYDEYNDITHEVFVTFKDIYGTRVPMVHLRNLRGSVISSGMLDIDTDKYTSGSYQVKNVPIDSYPRLRVDNLTESKIEFSVPILENFEIPYSLPAKGTIFVPKTEWSRYYLTNLVSNYSVDFSEL